MYAANISSTSEIKHRLPRKLLSKFFQRVIDLVRSLKLNPMTTLSKVLHSQIGHQFQYTSNDNLCYRNKITVTSNRSVGR